MANDQPVSEKLFITSTLFLIVGILLTNILFLCQQWHHFRQSYQVRYGLKVGMAIGNIIKALFSLPLITVDFLESFGRTESKTYCLFVQLATSYHIHFCTVVFSVAFVLLALELVFRSQPQVSRKFNTSVILNVAVCCVPWVAGCVFALPVSMSNVEWEYDCFYTSRDYLKLTHVLCIIVPATIALIACCVVVCFVAKREGQENRMLPHARHVAHEPVESAVPLKSPEEPELEATAAMHTVSVQQSYQTCQSAISTTQQDPPPTSSTARSNNRVGNMQEYIFRKEKTILMLSSVIFFFSVITLPCVSFMILLNDDIRHTLNVEVVRSIVAALYVIFGVHSSLIPLIWIPIAKL